MHLQNQPHRDARSHGQVLWWPGDGAVERDAEERGSAQAQGKQFHRCHIHVMFKTFLCKLRSYQLSVFSSFPDLLVVYGSGRVLSFSIQSWPFFQLNHYFCVYATGALLQSAFKMLLKVV